MATRSVVPEAVEFDIEACAYDEVCKVCVEQKCPNFGLQLASFGSVYWQPGIEVVGKVGDVVGGDWDEVRVFVLPSGVWLNVRRGQEWRLISVEEG